MEIAVLFALILLNGLFAMSELALVNACKWLWQALRGGDQVEWEPWWLEYK